MKVVELKDEEIDLLIDGSWCLYDNVRDNKKYIEDRMSTLTDVREDGRVVGDAYYQEALYCERKIRDLIIKLYIAKEGN